MGRTGFLVKVESTWIQRPGVFPLVVMKTSHQHIEY